MNQKRILFLLFTSLSLLLFSIPISSTSFGVSQVSSNIGIYWDQACTQPVNNINWGTLNPGNHIDKIVYIRNEMGVKATLSLGTNNWNPPEAVNYLHISWNYNGQVLNSNQVLPVTLTLSVDPNIQGITDFSVDIIITGNEVVDTSLGNPIISPNTPTANTAFTIYCPTGGEYGCIGANASKNNPNTNCPWTGWDTSSGYKGIFNCKGMAAGSYISVCYAVGGPPGNCIPTQTEKLYNVVTTSTTSSSTSSTSTTIPRNYLIINGSTFTKPQALNITGWSDDLSTNTYMYKNATSRNPDFLMQKGVGKQFSISLSSAWTTGGWNISVNSTNNKTLEWKTFQVLSTTTSTTTTRPPEPTTKLTVGAIVDVLNKKIPNVQVNVDGVLQNTDPYYGQTEFMITPGNHILKVDTVSNRFSHFWDSDCSDTNTGWYLDTVGSAATYTFTMYNRDRVITAYYKTLTRMTDTNGNPKSFEYNGTYLKGRLLDETNIPIIKGPKNYHPVCEDYNNKNYIDVDKNVILEYSVDGVNWNYLGTATADDYGYWLYPWNRVPRTAKLSANYTPTNWFYYGTGVIVNYIPCSGDVDGNRIVNLIDLVKLAFAYDSKSGDSRWNPDADFNKDNNVNLQDLVNLASHYGWNYDSYCNFMGYS